MINFSDSGIGCRIYNLRVKHDVQQGELARAIQLHQSVLNRIEHGTRPARDNEIRDIARFFAVSADFLLGIDSSDRKHPPTITADHAEVLLSDSTEIELIKKFRALDERGKHTVIDLLKQEYAYTHSS